MHERFSTERVLDALCREDGPTVVVARADDARAAPRRRPAGAARAALGAPGGRGDAAALLARAAGRRVPVAATYGLTEACSQVVTNGAPLFCTRVRLAPDGEILVSGPTRGPAGRPRARDGRPRALDARRDARGRRPQGRHDRHRRRERRADRGRGRAAGPSGGGRGGGARAAPHPEWGEAVVATVVLRPGAHVTEAALRAHCAARLAGFQVPKDIAFATALPRTASGKVVRRALR